MNIKSLIFHVFVPLMLSFTISMFLDYGEYLSILDKPFEIPSIVFQIVWPILYVLMGLFAYVIDNSDNPKTNVIMKIYYLQLFINFGYSIVFFYFQNIVLAAIMTITLLVMVIVLINKSYSIKKFSSYLLIPYFIWLVIANYLQIGIYFLN